jgi:type II secretory pathway component GspD/PulD (secretin)
VLAWRPSVVRSFQEQRESESEREREMREKEREVRERMRERSEIQYCIAVFELGLANTFSRVL